MANSAPAADQKPLGDAGTRYAPGLQEYVERFERALPPDFYLIPDVAEQRRMYDALSELFHYEPPASVAITDRHACWQGLQLSCRVYQPDVRVGNGCVFYMRGGGFVIGSLHGFDWLVADLAEQSGLLTVAMDFRLAPEHPFPTPLEDCYAGLLALMAGAFELPAAFDPARLVLAGDSSGANMAVAMSMMARDRQGPSIAGMALLSPVLDFARWQQGGEDSPLLSGGEMAYFTASYCPRPGQVNDPLVSPLRTGSFEGMPPAYILGAELDSLRTDGLELARRLAAAGTAVEHVLEPGLLHSCVRARAYSPRVAQAWSRYCLAVRRLAGSSGGTDG
jgi:acetyl esterase